MEHLCLVISAHILIICALRSDHSLTQCANQLDVAGGLMHGAFQIKGRNATFCEGKPPTHCYLLQFLKDNIQIALTPDCQCNPDHQMRSSQSNHNVFCMHLHYNITDLMNQINAHRCSISVYNTHHILFNYLYIALLELISSCSHPKRWSQ